DKDKQVNDKSEVNEYFPVTINKLFVYMEYFFINTVYNFYSCFYLFSSLDKITREAVEDAIITDIKTGNIVYSDKKGYFFFEDVRGDSLLISEIGYKSAIIIVEAGKTLAVEMEKGPVTL